MTTTINSVSFNLNNMSVVSAHRSVRTGQPGSDTNHIVDMGYSGLTLNLNCHATSLSDYDEVVAEFMGEGEPVLSVISGWQFRVHSTQIRPQMLQSTPNYYPFNVTLITSTPYRESSSSSSYIKTITTADQEWSADDSANDIETTGTVHAVPDIKITGNGTAPIFSVLITYDAPELQILSLGWDGTNMWSTNASSVDTIYKHNADMSVHTTYNSPAGNPTGVTWDGSNIWSCDSTSSLFYKHNADMTVNTSYAAIGLSVSGMVWDGSNMWSCDAQTDLIYKHNANMTVNASYAAPSTQPNDLAWDGTSIWSSDNSTDLVYKHKADMTVDSSYAVPGSNISAIAWDATNLFMGDNSPDKIYKMFKDFKIDVDVYNIADTSIKCRAASSVLYTAVHRINTDGSGSITYADDFSTTKWDNACTHTLTTLDAGNDKLDLTSGGYIYYAINTQYPVTGIPTLTAQVDITTGTPTIQISSDASTWYTIDTSIVDDVSTEYELDNDANLSLDGLTLFYYRLDSDSATCSIKSFTLDVELGTIDAQHPVINAGVVNTFRCDRASDSTINYIVELVYRDRSWA